MSAIYASGDSYDGSADGYRTMTRVFALNIVMEKNTKQSNCPCQHIVLKFQELAAEKVGFAGVILVP